MKKAGDLVVLVARRLQHERATPSTGPEHRLRLGRQPADV
jgi:hypothetical protein